MAKKLTLKRRLSTKPAIKDRPAPNSKSIAGSGGRHTPSATAIKRNAKELRRHTATKAIAAQKAKRAARKPTAASKARSRRNKLKVVSAGLR